MSVAEDQQHWVICKEIPEDPRHPLRYWNGSAWVIRCDKKCVFSDRTAAAKRCEDIRARNKNDPSIKVKIITDSDKPEL